MCTGVPSGWWGTDPAPHFNSRLVSSRAGLERRGSMLWTVFVVLLVLWALGMVSSYTIGGFIHVLLVVALVVLVIRLVQGRPV